ncbi:MAG: endonuclease/exonuclease/phosphatase family protein [Paracoccaceae bacterium]
MRRIVVLAIVLAALALAAGYLGALHPAGDSLAVFRPQVALLLAALGGVALMVGARAAGRWALALAALVALTLAGHWWPGPAGGGLRLYQKNMLYNNADLPALAADIRAVAPDVLTLQEVSQENLAFLDGLADVLPHRLTCEQVLVGGPALATRLPPVPGREICGHGMTALQVTGPDGPLWLVSVHLHWPWPQDQAHQIEELLPDLAGLSGPVVMAGDFNMVRWSQALRTLRKVTGGDWAGPVRGSYIGFAPLALLPIDHVLAPGGGRIETRPALGSDHLGLVADLWP